MELYELTATEALRLIKAGEISSEEVLESCLARISVREPGICAWSHIEPQTLLDHVRKSALFSSGTLLGGLPIGIKDVIDVAGMPTACNSPIYANRYPARDAACVAMLRLSGGTIMGKTGTVEFAVGGRRPPTKNPRNPEHTPGASSSGSAAAVADFMVPLSFGTQSVGSIIRPATFSGIHAFKPSFGLISLEGCKPAAPAFDTLGWFARCVDDLQLVADIFRAHGERRSGDGLKPKLAGLKIGLCRTEHWQRSEPCARDTLTAAAKRLSDAGVEIIELSLPDECTGLSEAQQRLMFHQYRTSLQLEYAAYHDDLSADIRDMIERSSSLTGDDIAANFDKIARARIAYDQLFETTIDAVLTLGAPGPAPKGLQSTGDPIFNGLWTALHAPCVAVPVTETIDGLPLGVQLVGQRYGDQSLLAIAKLVSGVVQPVPTERKGLCCKNSTDSRKSAENFQRNF